MKQNNYQENILNLLRSAKRDFKYEVHDLLRKVTKKHILSQIVNEKEIRVAGLKRSGNHAIINWIRKQHTGEVWHLNNIPVSENPYRFLYKHYPREHLRREALGNFIKKDCLIYSHEDYSLELITNTKNQKNHDLYLGKSQTIYDIIILRDPFNLLASRIKKNYMQVKDNSQTVLDLWLEYAKEYLGETDYFKNQKVCINYNQWFIDPDYRKQLASQLEFQFSDAGINQVKGQGGGSSFEGKEFDGKASEMDVLNRYKGFENDPNYQELLKNEEVLEYSRKIFGHTC
ncbi:MAG TPA: hypothetical protein DEG17_17385 [Cyanobacteria bacterium UBA11149]|nr:hypothetical protein [Cyanobacteria bacterium UBA11367]HBE57353.1 hypothetical protein [Cyanobacteria bacterium UBA11366]HBK66977.1 hypothetical protein [Cyanobacteria bacterium UBA11166]HBR76835.1 hypothetical protein [Cyanobacteria bacterium UBA11159]HBS72592.1 hypothetical protein [Cyanobacteria bacterium UBA11153]HBW90595.1 hypothetical protein [Cyanobacteria bacterium UBA11149]HCA94901.1 hypothetical protein [Cyanobacteria bacterium UBA9226]